jgi:hypothetical protein
MLIRLRRTPLSKTPHALADGLMLVFQHPVKGFSEAFQTFSGMAHDFEKTIFQNPM